MAERLSDAQRRRLAGALASESIADTPSGSSPGEAALMVAGAMAGPMGARAAQYSPKAFAALLSALGLSTPTNANQESPYDRTMRDYTKQQSSTRAEIERLRAERRALEQAAAIEEKSGKGPKWQSELRKVNEWDRQYGGELNKREAELEAISNRMDAYDKENSPAAVRKRNAEVPTKELFPGATMATQAALAAVGLGTSMAMRGRNAIRFNAEMNDLDSALKKSLEKGNAAQASAMSSELRNLDIAGPSRKGTLAPTIAGFELGAFAPTAADYYRSGGDPDSPLYKKAVKSVIGGEGIKKMLGYEVPGTDLAARVLMAGLLGAGASKIGNTAVDAAIGRAPLPRSHMVRAGLPSPAPTSPGGNGGSPPARPPAGPTEGQLNVQPPPTPPPTPRNPAPTSQPPYGPGHSQLSQSYIDDVLTSGQGLPTGKEMATELSNRYASAGLPAVRSPELTRRSNLTKSAIEAGADPKVLTGKAGFLAVPGTMIGSTEIIPPELLASIVRELSYPQ